ncbi:MAG: HlyD family efflux transporter periplasmic adaptor subunit [Proteobacteria bacterium]|nr:MAG: HlyD family efflux transporter periplasmic adaptor subunit [Pseudomonadota bacterium]
MKKNLLIVAAVVLTVTLGAVVATSYATFSPRSEPTEEVRAEKGSFKVTVAAGGTVEPENKISIISPIGGRIDELPFEEGSRVKRGQVIGWMSSTDRAALMDSAQVQGGDQLKDLAQVYKPTPILSPTEGEIISRKVVVGQTVNQQTVLFELSDRLIVTADVDETDLGKIWVGQTAFVTVESYRTLIVKTKVMRIARQSEVKNSINTYEVLLVPEELPKEFRAGLTATVQFLISENPSAVLLPTWVAEGRDNFAKKMTVLKPDGESEERVVKFGLSDGEDVEVKEGLKPGDVVVVKSQKVLAEKRPKAAFGVGGAGGGEGKK